MPEQQVKRHFSFHIHITTLFSVLILFCGLLIGWNSYSQLSESILNSGKQIFTESSQQVEQKLLVDGLQISTMLKILTASNLAKAKTTEQKLSNVAALKEMLNGAKYLRALFIAYPNNDFLLFRKIKSTQSSQPFDVPQQSKYMLTVYDNSVATHRFYDHQLQLILQVNDPSYELDSKSRPWYIEAKKSKKVISTAAYLFYSSQELGMTKAIFDKKNNVVIGADYALTDISNLLASFKSYPNSESIILNRQGEIIAYQTPETLLSKNGKFSQLKTVSDLDVPVLEYVFNNYLNQADNIDFTFEGQHWLGRISKIRVQNSLYLIQLTSTDELLLEAYILRNEASLMTLLIIILTLPIAWYFSKLLTSPIRQLTSELQSIKNFDFSKKITTRSVIKEINELVDVTSSMKETISHFQDLSASLVAKQSFQDLLKKITQETNALSHSIGSMILLSDNSNNINITYSQFRDYDQSKHKQLHADLEHLSFKKSDILALIDVQNNSSNSSQLPQELTPFIKEMQPESDCFHWHLLPLNNSYGECLGVLAVINSNQNDDFKLQRSFIKATATFSSLAIEGQLLLIEQKDLLESFIQLIASAIDSKSPYIGGHCTRVPELTKMLCQTACDNQESPFADFNLNDEQWEELHIAAWLHDCGKIVTPEYIVDKATKLETIYDRIHEVRMRFEVLKQQAHSQYWQGCAQGQDETHLAAHRDNLLNTLDKEFTFIAECNIGGEFMSDDKITRLNEIAQRTWTRTLDDQLGVSPQEKKRRTEQSTTLPVQEPLLANKTEHLIEREHAELTEPGNAWGFNMKTPEYRFNRGELYNLSIQRGTLTDEDRFIINGHMVHTIVMLSKLPFPNHLKNVPLIAGGHHEKMDGSGYPRAIVADKLPLTARIMVIADIFEALTASDRPYKERKTLSQSIQIMSFMVKDQHIDPELFRLFLSSGIYLQYAQKYLLPDQIDDVDIYAYL